MKRIFVLLLTLSIVGYLVPVSTSAQATTVSVDATPLNASISGSDAGNQNTSEVYFNLTSIDSQSDIVSAKLIYVQTGVSNGQVKFINKYDFALIDNKLLNNQGQVEALFFKDKVREWVATPSKNLGIFVQGSDLESNAAINLLGLRLEINYLVADTTAPSISQLTITEMTSTSVSLNWTASEPVKALVEYGRTSLYGSTVESASYSAGQELLINELRAGSTYHFRLTLTDVAGNKTSSEDKAFTLSTQGSNSSSTQEIVSTLVLAPPRILNAEYRHIKDDEYAIELAWEASKSADIDGYLLYRAQDGKALQEYKRLDRNTLRFSDLDVHAGKSYSYFVRGYKNLLITESSPQITIELPESSTGEVAGIDTKSIAEPQRILLTVAFASFIIFVCYITFKALDRYQKRPKVKRLHNVLKDPEFYMNKYESTVLQKRETTKDY